MKKIALLLVAGLLAAAPIALAEHGQGGKTCPMSGGSGCSHGDCSKGGCSHGSEDCGSGGCPIVAKICKKSHFFLENKEALGLSDDQVTQIKVIKSEVKKKAILDKAQMQVGMMELEEKLSAPTLDVEGINKMLDDGMAGMAAGAKATVAQYAKLKAVLTPEQLAKAKTLWKQKK